jgi:hypothetical protein
VARVRVVRRNRGVVEGCQSGCSSIFYRLFLGGGRGGEGGVCGLRSCRSAVGAVGPLLELLVRYWSCRSAIGAVGPLVQQAGSRVAFLPLSLSRHTKR